MLQKIEELKNQSKYSAAQNHCPNCKQQEKLVYMYEKLVKLLKAKLNKYPNDQSKEGFFSSDQSTIKRALSENRTCHNKNSSFFESSKFENHRLGESQLTPFIKSISTNVSENYKIISKSNTYMKQMKELSNRIHKKDVRIANLTSDLLTLKSNMLSLRNIVFQFFRMTPLPKLSGSSLQTIKIITNIFEYSQTEKQVMFNKKDISHLLKTKQSYKIDANKSVYLPNFAEMPLRVP